METKSVSALKDIQKQLNEFRSEPFNQISITERCMTINEINYNFSNGRWWDLSIQTKEMKNKQMVQQDDYDSDEVEDDKAQNKDVVKYNVHSVRNIPWTQRQLVTLSIQSVDSEGELKIKNLFITKLQPGTRRSDLCGMRGRRDMDSINFIADDLYLIKFRSTAYSGIQDYWTVIDKFGQIQRIPKVCREYLRWSTFSAGRTRQTDNGSLLMLKGGQKKILSIATAVRYEE